MTGINFFKYSVWKNSKRDGKGLMIYANGDVYDGGWRNDA